MVIPSFILQKPSRNSRAKDRSEPLRRRMILWQSGDLLQLFKEAKTIQIRPNQNQSQSYLRNLLNT